MTLNWENRRYWTADEFQKYHENQRNLGVSKKNPYWKFVKGETTLHVKVAEYLMQFHPDLKFHHSQNEGKRTKYDQFLLKIMGVSKGFPDFIIFNEQNTLALELKIDDKTPEPEQLDWLNYFNNRENSVSFVAWTIDAAERIIDKFAGKNTDNNDHQSILVMGTTFRCLNSDKIPSKILKTIKF